MTILSTFTRQANVYGDTTLVRSIAKSGQNRLETVGYLTELACFIGILTNITSKPAMHVKAVTFIVHLMKNSSICHKNCEKTFELCSLLKVIVRIFFQFFASILILNYFSMENRLNFLQCRWLSYLLMGCPILSLCEVLPTLPLAVLQTLLKHLCHNLYRDT